MAQHHKNVLSDPELARTIWSKYWRFMRWMSLVAILSVALALYYLWVSTGVMPLSMLIATVAGVGLTVIVGTGLMGLVFLSSSTGHDEDVSHSEEGRNND